MLYCVVQKTAFEITFKFLYGLMYGIKEAIQPYMSYVWFPRNIYGGHPGFKTPLKKKFDHCHRSKCYLAPRTNRNI